MSHSKMRKRGRSLYVASWNPRAKKFIVTCVHCGHQGFHPSILEDGFAKDRETRTIRAELTKILEPLELDEFGRCSTCAQQGTAEP